MTWSNADLKANNALTVLTAQGAGKMIQPISWFIKLNYGGNNAFVGSPNCNIQYNGVTETAFSSLGSSFWTATQSFICYNPSVNFEAAATALENQTISLKLSAGVTGNAANDNTVTVILNYAVTTI
nr:hypothetical protein [Crucivirus sp.]